MNEKILVLVFSGMMSVFLPESCQGVRMRQSAWEKGEQQT